MYHGYILITISGRMGAVLGIAIFLGIIRLPSKLGLHRFDPGEESRILFVG